ncbi:MAG: T9SS type A sorting domain-containing protein [Chitinophagaceae bacterium]|nr:T9SS type A sorting domain-containing protein [Chitinophagaceae bacterium]
MKRIFYVFILSFFVGILNLSAQTTELDPSDPDVVYTSSNHPNDPPQGSDWSKIKKWGHSNVLGWNPYSYGYKSYIYKGMAFRLKFPKTYQHGVNDGKKYPVYIFLHGKGEPGPIWDNEKSLLWGAQLHAQAVDQGKFDGFVIYPQATQTTYDGWLMGYRERVVELIQKLAEEVKADVDRVIISGLSSGGFAAWDYLRNSPKVWAANVVISSAYDYNNIASWLPDVITVPVWLSNGGKDKSPSPYVINIMVDAYNDAGGNLKHLFYPDLAHNTWNALWAEPDYFDFLSSVHKAQPLVRYGKTEFCAGEDINVSLELQPGFYQYQWQKDGVTITSATNESLVVTEVGTYRGRFKRTATSDWSEWSPRPIEIKLKNGSALPVITVENGHSRVVPSPDGNTTVPLILTAQFNTFDWRRTSDNAQVGTQYKYNAPAGEYTVKVTQNGSCGAEGITSDPFKVINANGQNGPDKALDLTAVVNGTTSISLNWDQNPAPQYNETAFEIYRSTKSGSDYKFIGQVGADVLSYTDNGLSSGVEYYYVVRAVNDNAAAPLSNEASAATFSDKTPPTIPQNLEVGMVTRTSVELSWTPSSDVSGVKNYDIYVNGVKTYTVTSTNFVVNDLTEFTNYSFYVRARDVADNVSAPSAQVAAFTRNNGLNYKVYEGTWSNLPDFSTLTPVKRGVSANVDISVSERTENYAMLWEGYIYIPTKAKYTFYIESDDGSAMYLDNWYSSGGAKFINNDGVHAMTEKSNYTSSNYSVGYHKIAFTYFQQAGGQDFKVYWKIGNGAKQLIPDQYFRDQEEGSSAVPAKPTNLSAVANAYNKVTLGWTDNSNNETGFEVYRKESQAGEFEMVALLEANITSYLDEGVNGGAAYEYKVQAVNNNGASGFNGNPVGVTTPAAPPIPDVPGDVSLQALSNQEVELSFTDYSNQIGYEIYRSVNVANDFKLWRSLNTSDDEVSIVDDGLFPHQAVYYKVRAIGEVGVSEFSQVASGETLNSNPEVTPVVRDNFLSVYTQGTTIIPIAASDLDGDELTISLAGLPSFATFTPGGNGTGNLVFNTSIANVNQPFEIEVTASDNYGGVGTYTFSGLVSYNRPPTLSRVPSMNVNEGGTLLTKLSGFDPDRGTYLKFGLRGEPSFVEGRVTDGFYIVANPDFGDAGTYNFWVIVWDGHGGFDSSQATLVVNKATPPTQKVFVNILDSGTPPEPGFPWNNVTGTSTTSLVDEDGMTTGINLTFNTNQWNTTSSGGGTGNQSGVFPDEVIRDNFYFGTAGIPDQINLTFSGLEAGKQYNLCLFSASAVNNGATVFTVGGQTKTLEVLNNTSNTALFKSVTADGSGEIMVEMSKAAGTSIGYLNAMYLEKVYDDGKLPKAPTNLTATLLADRSVQLDWEDNAYNENGYVVLRSESETNGYVEVEGGLHNANETSFVDVNTTGNKTYYYKVYARNSNGNSDMSDIATVSIENRIPELEEIADVYLNSGQTNTINLEATDDAGETLTFEIVNRPSFVTIQNTGNGTATLTIAPQAGDEGIYKDITVSVTDPAGASISKSFLAAISNSNIRSVYINIGPVEATPEPGPWNNYLEAPGNTAPIVNLIDDRNINTGFSFKFNTGLSGGSLEGMVDAGQGILPDNIMSSALYLTGTGDYVMEFNGLASDKKYNVAFFSSRNHGELDSASFTSGGKTVYINGSYNTSRKVQLNELTPSSGKIQVTISKKGATPQFFLNAIILEEYTSGTTVVNSPADLVAQPTLSNKSVLLTWTDRSNNENGFQVYRSTGLNGPYTLIKTTAANVTSYEDNTTSLVPGTVYYYKVRARKTTSPATNSEYSRTVRFGLAKNLVLFSMNTNALEDTHQGIPWNNMDNLTSAAGVTVQNLINTEIVETGYDFVITEGFNGVYWYGMTPGVFPDNVMKSTVWTGAGQTSSIKYTNLNFNKRYRIGIMNSTMFSDQPYVAKISINGKIKKVNSALNTRKLIYFDNIVPDKDGEIHVSITPDAGSALTITNAFTLESYDTPTDDYFPQNNFRSGNETSSNQSAADLLSRDEKNELRVLGKEISLNAYPNPVVSNLMVKIQLPVDVKGGIIELYDISGKLTQRKIFDGYVGNNLLKLTLDKALAPGNYVLKLTVNSESRSMLIIKRQ